MAVVPVEDVERSGTAPEAARWSGLPRPLEGDRWTWRDLDRLPEDDGLRYEVLHGALVVNASPRWDHQKVARRVARALEDACPSDLDVNESFDVVLPDGDSLQPDVLVVRRDQVQQRAIFGPPVLVVEVLSESTRRRDLGDKRERYTSLGVPRYWVVDADAPWLLELRLDTDPQVEVLHEGPGPHRLTLPFQVDVRLR